MEAMCKQIHNTLTREFKYALVWGVSAKHSPQRVGLTHQLADEDVVQVRAAGTAGSTLTASSLSCCLLHDLRQPCWVVRLGQ
jgi:predicted ribonuclease YlaK